MALPKNMDGLKKAKIGIKVPWFLVIPGLVCALIAHFIAPIQGAFMPLPILRALDPIILFGLITFKTMWESTSDKLAILNTFKLAMPPLCLLTCVLGLILAFGFVSQF